MRRTEPLPPDAGLVVERPPPGLAQGKVAAPGWVVLALGFAVVLFGLAYIILRLGRRQRK